MMMNLASSALRAAAANMFSPSKNACMVAVTPTVSGARRYRHDPYRATVLAVSPSKMMAPPTPEKAACAAQGQKQPLQPRAQNYQQTRATMAAGAAAPIAVAGPAPLYTTVQFKHTTATYVCALPVRMGDRVIVEGDRGVNMGTVTAVTATKPSFPVPSKVLRLATAQEADSQSGLRRKEAVATRRITELAEANAPAMKIVDCEFQLDSNKLTIFFAAKRLVDFRQLQRALFREFKCRVWLLNWNEVCPNKPLPCN